MKLLLWPFVALSRVAAIAVGLVLMLAGGILTATVVGAVVGIPLMAFGFALVIRGFF